MFTKIKQSISSFSQLVAIIALILISLSVVRSIVKIVSAQRQVEGARLLLQKEQAKQQELKEKLTKVQSLEYKEREARDKLGLAREDEIVVIMPDEDVLRRISPRSTDARLKAPRDPNWKRWLKLFLGV